VLPPARWTADELARRALLERGVAVAVSLRRHGNLIAWANERGRRGTGPGRRRFAAGCLREAARQQVARLPPPSPATVARVAALLESFRANPPQPC